MITPLEACVQAHGRRGLRPTLTCIATLLAVLVMAGCNDSEGLAARVDQAPITVDEVDFLLQRRGLSPESATVAQRAKAEEELIDQALFVQQARKLELDQHSTYVQATKDLLARAYLDHLLNEIEAPTPEAMKSYYESHPELFRERRRYHLQEIAIQAEGSTLQAVEARFESMKTFNDLLGWLKVQGIPYKVAATVKSADEVPADLLSHLHAAQEGQSLKVRVPGGMAALQVVSITPDPVTYAQAEADIRKYLRNRILEGRLRETTRQLRAQAKIERYGQQLR